MGIFNQNADNEKEMSGGLMFGYALGGFALLVVIIFGIFAVSQVVKNKVASDEVTQQESEININTLVDDDNAVSDDAIEDTTDDVIEDVTDEDTEDSSIEVESNNEEVEEFEEEVITTD